jgi:hypothetical protein
MLSTMQAVYISATCGLQSLLRIVCFPLLHIVAHRRKGLTYVALSVAIDRYQAYQVRLLDMDHLVFEFTS